ncbi:MAG TPA: AAA family ATPase [Patescibacteria group bacterium]|nr:AAA family ATPase [Patescibacteria group bacterium]
MGGSGSSPRLVGRREELARLRDAVADAAGGRARLVLVSGDAGIGKSRLLAELLRSQALAGVHVLAGGCLAIADGGLPYAPLTGALRNLARTLDPAVLHAVLGAARAELARLLPDLRATDAPAVPAVGPAGRADQARFFELVLGLLGRLGADRPVVFVVEDLHWADDATRDLLTYLAGNLRTERVAVIATYRTDDAGGGRHAGSWLPDLLRATAGERIELGPLAPEDVAEQLRGILGAPPPPGVVVEIARRSGGNAFFVEELIAAGVGEIGPGAGMGPGDERHGTAGRLSRTLRETLTARTRNLPPATDLVLRALAVAGRDVDDRLLVAATGLPPGQVHAAVHDALDRHLALVAGDPPLVGLRHVLLREAIVADLLAGERRTLHAAFATALAEHPELADRSPAGAAGELAHHWAAADHPVEAFAAALTAAAKATEVRAHAEAARHRRRALDLLHRLPPAARATAPGEIDLLLAAEESADLAGDFAGAAALVERGRSLVDPATDPLRAATLESRLGYHRWLAGRNEEAVAHHERAVELVPAEPPSLLRARVLRGLGGALMGIGRYRESVPVCEAAIEAARAADAPIEEGRALDMLGVDLVGIGDIERGIEALQAACALARLHDPAEGLIVALHNLSYHLALVDRTAEALAAALDGIEVARTVGLDRRYGVNLRAAAADVLLRRGRWDEADVLVEEGRSLDPAGEGSLYLVIVRIRLTTARGRFTEALAALEVGERMAEGDVDFDLAAYLHTAAAELRCWEGRPDLAAGAVTRGLAALEGSEDVFLAAPLLALGCRVAADRVDAARAWGDDDALAAARAEAGRFAALLDTLAGRGPGGRQPTTLGFATTTAWARGELRRAAGDRDPEAWLALARAWTDLEAPAAAAYARWRRAEALLGERTDRAAAAEDLRAAAAAAADLGATPLAEAVAALARRARVDLAPAAEASSAEMAPPSPPPPAAADGRGPDAGRRRLAEMGLSAREIQVLELVAAGRSNGEIAEVLFIARKTVSVHVSHILARLAVPSRVAAAAIALRLGLVDGEANPDVTGAPAAEAAARTFMFTDIVGSTALIEAIGDAAWADLRAWHDAALRRLFTAHGGIEVDHAGDGFFVAFASAAPAIDCAVAIQRALAGHRRTAGFAPTVRIGIHHGEATRTATGWAGREVHLAARLAARAGASEILASAGTLASAGLRPAGAQTVSLPGLAGTVAVAPVPWR